MGVLPSLNTQTTHNRRLSAWYLVTSVPCFPEQVGMVHVVFERFRSDGVSNAHFSFSRFSNCGATARL